MQYPHPIRGCLLSLIVTVCTFFALAKIFIHFVFSFDNSPAITYLWLAILLIVPLLIGAITSTLHAHVSSDPPPKIPDGNPCPTCGYDRRATLTRCPECGTTQE